MIALGTHVIIQKVKRPDRAHMIGKCGVIKKFEKTDKGIFCHLQLDDGGEWISLKENISETGPEQGLEDLEDVYICDQRKLEIRAGHSKTHTLDEVERDLGLS